MFAIEADLTASATRWMRDGGLDVRAEFITPWGMCDLVGASFNRKHIVERLRLGQKSAVTSITRASILLEIPDVETGKSIKLDTLVRRFASAIPEHVVLAEVARFVVGRFVEHANRAQVHRVNGWMPLHKRLVAVELKLARIEEAMRQALDNLGFATESYVGLPMDVAHRVAASPERWSRFFDAGVGLLSVARHGCEAVVKARRSDCRTDQAVQLYCVEKFWRTRLKDS